MKGFLTWRFGIAISCGITIGIIVIFWDRIKTLSNKNKSDSGKKKCYRFNNNNSSNRILQLAYPRWKKIGKVKELYFYPLKSGCGKELCECQFTGSGIAVDKDGFITLRDRMFLIYNEENNKFITGRNYPKLVLVNLSAVDDFRVKLVAPGMSTLIIDMPRQCDMTSGDVNCSMWWGEEIKCIDCGSASAKWISKYLTDADSGLRLGLAPLDRRNILKGPWERFTKVYKTLTNDDVGLFADLASYMLLTESSLQELNEKLKNPISSLQLRPNIVVTDTESFAEDNWEWIKIGDSVVLRNVKPCPRCSMVRVNPDTGVMDDEEPLKTLKIFREQTDENKIKVDGKAPVMGIYCGLYTVGNVKINDDVFVHVPQTVRTTKL